MAHRLHPGRCFVFPRTEVFCGGSRQPLLNNPLPPHDCVHACACACVCVLGVAPCCGFLPPSAPPPRSPGCLPSPACVPSRSGGVDFGGGSAAHEGAGSPVRCVSSLSEPAPTAACPSVGLRPRTPFWEETVWPVFFRWTQGSGPCFVRAALRRWCPGRRPAAC